MDEQINETPNTLLYIKPLEFDQAETDEVTDVLQSWGLAQPTCDIILAGGIFTIKHLECLELDGVNEFFSDLGKMCIGEKALFVNKLKQWRHAKDIPMLCDKETESASNTSKILDWLESISSQLTNNSRSSSSASCSNDFLDKIELKNQCQLDQLLESCDKGKLILSFYAKHDILDSKNQRDLCHIITNFYKSKQLKMSYMDMDNWAKRIEFLIPNEKSTTYFMPRKPGKKNPTGKLHSRWANIHEKTTEQNEEVEKIVTFEKENDELLEIKCWLSNNCSPWTEVCAKWEITAPIRIPKFQHSPQPIYDLLRDWPRFDDPDGYQLIDIDFEILFPNKQNLLLNDYDNFCKKILPIFESEIKDKQSKQLLKSLKEQPLNTNSQHCIIAMLLHSVLVPKRISKTYKPTILDSQTDFVIQIYTINDLQPKLELLREKCRKNNENIQPKIIVVGTNLENITEFYVFFNNIKYKVFTFVKCIDIIIKLVYVYSLKYSHISKLVWSFLEEYFFDLSSEKFSEVTNLINKLNHVN